jgi:hypothetical protein
MRKIVLSIALLGFTQFPAHASPPLGWYDNWRALAPEQLIIEVSSVHQILMEDSERYLRVDITAKAKVQSVVRTGVYVKRGEAITIRYLHDSCKGCIGSSPIPVLTEGAVYSAFLTGTTENQFVPAARNGSFIDLKGGKSKSPTMPD